MHPAISAAYQDTSERLAKEFLAAPTALNLAYFHLLPKLGLAPALRQGVAATIRRLQAFPRVSWPEESAERLASPSSDAEKASTAEKLVEQGRLGTAARVISTSDEVADPSAPDTLAALRSKHPEGPPRPFGDAVTAPLMGRVPTAPNGDALRATLARFKSETAPGPSGWTVPLLRTAMRSEAVTDMITMLASSVLDGKAVGREFLLAARLIPLRKSDGGVRPIAVGELLYRLIMKAVLRANVRRTMFLANQFGVQTLGGVEPVVHAVRAAAFGDRHLDNGPFTHLVSLDFSNAFNTLDRTALAQRVRTVAPELLRAVAWAYGHPSDLVLGDGSTVLSSQGVRQGCPLGPFLFSLGVQPLLESLNAAFGAEGVVLAYLDDIYALTRHSDGLERAREAVRASATLGLALNDVKSTCTTLSDVKTAGLDVLGSHVGPPSTTAEFLSAKIDAEARKLVAVRRLPAQCALLLLTRCLQLDLRHLQRTLPVSEAVQGQWQRLDALFADAVLGLREAPIEASLQRRALARRLIALPARLGGMGILAHASVAPHALAASLETAAEALVPLGLDPGLPTPTEDATRTSQRERCAEMHNRAADELMADLTVAERVAVAENASPIGRRWLGVIPWCPWLRLDHHDVAAGLRARTLWYPAASGGPSCPRCRGAQTIGHPEVCPRVTPAMKEYTPRHTVVVRALGEMLKTLPDVTVHYEPRISFAGAPLRRDDLRFLGSPSSNLPSVSVDVTVVSLYAGVRERTVQTHLDVLGQTGLVTQAQTACRTVLAAEAEAKRRRHPGCSDGLPFVPFALSSGGILEECAEIQLQRWIKALTPFATSFLLDRVAIGLLRVRGRISAFWH